MPGISLCYGVLPSRESIMDCPVRDKCYWFNTKGSGNLQEYFVPPKITKEGCELFQENLNNRLIIYVQT